MHLHGDVTHFVRKRLGDELLACFSLPVLSRLTAKVIVATWTKRDLGQLLRYDYPDLVDGLADTTAEMIAELMVDEAPAAG